MRRIMACCLVGLLLCCGCSAQGKPKPIHLEDEAGLAGLLPGSDKNAPEATSRPTGSDVLDQLLGLQEELDIPQIEGIDAEALYREYLALKADVDKIGKSEEVDQEDLLSRISRAQDTLNLTIMQATSAKAEGKITEEQADMLNKFIEKLNEGLADMKESLRQVQ